MSVYLVTYPMPGCEHRVQFNTLEEAMAFAEFKLESPETMGADVKVRKLPKAIDWIEVKE